LTNTYFTGKTRTTPDPNVPTYKHLADLKGTISVEENRANHRQGRWSRKKDEGREHC